MQTEQKARMVTDGTLRYEYDKSGNICKITEDGLLSVRYQYDGLNRLIREDNRKIGQTTLFSYDRNGNILSKRSTAFTLRTDVEGCEFEEKLYRYDGDRLTSYDGESFRYDAIGNPEIYRGNMVSWTNGRQMIYYTGTAFGYDGQGRRTNKGQISFTYDSQNRLIKQSDGLEFLYDMQGISAVKKGGSIYPYRKDAQGNIAAILDNTGKVVVKYEYDAWGNHAVLCLNRVQENGVYKEVFTDQDGTFDAGYIPYQELGKANPFRYRSYYYDTETELYYLKSRYYDPEVGRFITIDDISFLAPDIINGLNLYAYCGNNPILYTDSDGTFIDSNSEAIDFLSFLLEEGIGGGIALVGWAVKTGARPNNIGYGVFKRAQIKQLSQLTKLSKVLSKAINVLTVVSVALTVFEGIQYDIARGYSTERIVSNAITNAVVYGGVTFGLSLLGGKVGFLLGSIVPGLGNVVGAAIGFVLGLGIGFLFDMQINGKSIIEHIRDGVYSFWKWIFG